MAIRNRTRNVYRVFAILALLVAGLGSLHAAPPPAAKAAALPRTAFVHLFEWKWSDVAQECENWLGPKGFAGVQVSPPEEHAVVSGNPWWERYQPVSYQIQSRSGSRAEFANMVSRCNAVGVAVYADAVINHMTGVGSGTGIAGSSYSAYNYPGLYGYNDFHHCGRNGNDDIVNYADRWEVQNCELVNLADLNTGSTYVQNKLAAYMNDLSSLGVAGFRIDAAKHIDTNELHTILGKLTGTPYIYQEVIDQGGEPITANEYFQNGDVTEFKYSTKLGPTFLSGKLADLSQFGPAWGFMPSDTAVVFTDNHDNQRGSGGGGTVVTYKNGRLYDLANIFMLAWPYGYPEIMSSYAFSTSDQGPPANADGSTKTIYSNGVPNCFGEWVCEHRWRDIANMVAFRNYTSSYFATTNWWSNGNNAIAFGRGDKGFVVINRESFGLNQTWQTGLPAGTYCDVTKGDLSADGLSCSGPTVTVNGAGQITAAVASMDAIAIYGGAKLGGSATPVPTATATTPAGTVAVTFNANVTTAVGQNVYVSGNVAALGAWNTAAAVPLSSANYPVWGGTVNLPANTAIQYKYIKKDSAGNVTWESTANRTFTTPASGSVVRNETWEQLATATPAPPTATATVTRTPTPAPTATRTPTPSASVAVTFNANVTTVFGQNVYISGNIAALGGWNTASAVPLSSANYPIWSATVNLPPGTAVQYKYIKKDGSGTVIWEGGSNRTFTTPASGTLTRNDTWQP